ncbi:diaminobutyrate acetyltransferase [Paracoccus sp. (in: a-proteobacteria)]|uniref:diaminobutyrate acetyltransferase n=1 Tax=Paracoccus sp. TaxID=267 RepID=UPI00396C673B
MPDDLQDIEHPANLTLRKPRATDGTAIWELVRSCKPLDENSMYCNLVQAEHFRDTSVIAERDGQILGWISGHLIPHQDALFVWQVAVSPSARGLGLARKMLMHLVGRDECATAMVLKTTITRDNGASWALFNSLARQLDGTLDEQPHYMRGDHFGGHHPTEHMVTITLPQASRARAA